MPSIWYQVGLHCRPVSDACGVEVAGVSFAGAPGVVIGHNARIAWGFTNEGPDAMDLYVEKVNPANPNQYEVDGRWADMDLRTETIAVAGGSPVEITVRSTRHGLIVTDLLGLDDPVSIGSDVPDHFAVALEWRALEPSTLWRALIGFDKANNWDEFRQAASFFDIAAQNVVYADVEGNIGYQATGQIPIRSEGDGRYPAPGWDSSHEWTGFVPFEDLPHVFNPRAGMIVAANQPVISPAASPFMGSDFDYGYRARRIAALIERADGLQVDDMTAIQMDTYDYGAEILVPALLEVPNDEGSARIRGALSSWSSGPGAFLMDKDSAGAAAFAAVWRHLLEDTFDDQLPDGTSMDDGGRAFAVMSELLRAPDDVWWDDATTSEIETRNDILSRAMREADSELVERLGGDASAWKWGELHTAAFRNATFGESGIAPIELAFNRSAGPVSGSTSVVDAVGWSASDGYEVDWLPSMRMVVDLADLSDSTLIHTTGQSGHAFKHEYTSMIERWLDGRTAPMRWTRDQVDDGARGTLRLNPA
jgi:penicillin amidase